MSEDLLFNGLNLIWITNSNKSYKATSGMPGWQSPRFQRERDRGPTPEGLYRVAIFYNRMAEIGSASSCSLKPGWRIQNVPGKGDATSDDNKDCWDNYWVNWGATRLQFDPIKGAESAAPHRKGFYIHNSQKGYSHGCIEIENSFFEDLEKYIKSNSKKNHALRLKISYSDENMIINSGTGSWTVEDERDGQTYYNNHPEARSE